MTINAQFPFCCLGKHIYDGRRVPLKAQVTTLASNCISSDHLQIITRYLWSTSHWPLLTELLKASVNVLPVFLKNKARGHVQRQPSSVTALLEQKNLPLIVFSESLKCFLRSVWNSQFQKCIFLSEKIIFRKFRWKKFSLSSCSNQTTNAPY
jgi:hypothetical protein